MGSAVNGEELGFRFVSGHRALDFLSTLGDRHREPVERLRESADLDRWLVEAGLPVPTRATRDDLGDARDLREAVNRVTRAVLAGEAAGAADLDEVNGWARRRPRAPQGGPSLQRRWA